MPTPPAIQFSNVTKSYSLAGGIREQFLDAIGLPRFFRSARQSRTNFRAIDDVSFEVPRSSRYGLIGRNGAGKTTLLKLICGNFAPTSGKVDVHGAVQALMTMGHGFHPEYTGRDNIEASLQYNGLSRDDHREAVQSIIEFCELGTFLDQPFRTYSTGMQARLMFAAATAIKPDILIIDEVLGAGDAYFIAKSKRRVDVLVGTGCTLLLVSHSMQQVLELCDQVIWLDAGRIRMIGEALRVVKAYEEWMYGSIARLDGAPNAPGEVAVGATKVNGSACTIGVAAKLEQRAQRHLTLQTPTFLPHAEPAAMPNISSKDARVMRCEAPDGISRWEGAAGLKIVGLTLSGPKGPTDRIVCLQPACFTIFLEVETSAAFRCTYGIAIHDLKGRTVTRIFGPPDHFHADAGQGRRIQIALNPNQLGPGTYTLGISIHEESSIEHINAAVRYDLLARSFLFHIDLPDSLGPMSADYVHTAEWAFDSCTLDAASQHAGWDMPATETHAPEMQ